MRCLSVLFTEFRPSYISFPARKKNRLFPLRAEIMNNFPPPANSLQSRTLLSNSLYPASRRWKKGRPEYRQPHVTDSQIGGCYRWVYPPRPSASVDNTLLDLRNSSYPTKAEFNNC